MDAFRGSTIILHDIRIVTRIAVISVLMMRGREWASHSQEVRRIVQVQREDRDSESELIEIP